MFDNVGEKIEKVSTAITFLVIAMSLFVGLFAGGVGIIFAIIGSLMSYITGLFLTGFAELIKNTSRIANNFDSDSSRLEKVLAKEFMNQDTE